MTTTIKALSKRKNKAGGRKAKNVTIEEFKQILVNAAIKYDYTDSGCPGDELWQMGALYYLDKFRKPGKDLSKVIFDTENWTFTGEFDIAGFDGVSFVQRGNLVFLIGAAGGDWEEPVLFCLYVDNKGNVRGYIPEDGNAYDKKWKTAYGSQEENPDYEPSENAVGLESASEIAKDLFPSTFDGGCQGAPPADKELLFADICRRIVVAE